MIEAFTHIVFPPFCLHCEIPLEKAAEKFCPDCKNLFALAALKERCKGCFSDKICRYCRLEPPVLDGLAACFDPIGPPPCFSRMLEKESDPSDAALAASYMTAQLVALCWPFPDQVIPMPIHPLKHFFAQPFAAGEIAKELATILGRRWAAPLFVRKQIICKSLEAIEGNTVLLVDLYLHDKKGLEEAASLLFAQGAKAVFALTLIGPSSYNVRYG